VKASLGPSSTPRFGCATSQRRRAPGGPERGQKYDALVPVANATPLARGQREHGEPSRRKPSQVLVFARILCSVDSENRVCESRNSPTKNVCRSLHMRSQVERDANGSAPLVNRGPQGNFQGGFVVLAHKGCAARARAGEGTCHPSEHKERVRRRGARSGRRDRLFSGSARGLSQRDSSVVCGHMRHTRAPTSPSPCSMTESRCAA
jgi:hypothetical protein